MGNKRPFNAISDHWAKTDALHFDTYLPALSEILTSAETPLTLGIFGPWGSGKTTLLHMLEKIILEKGLANYRAVWFTAWKYDKQDALWRALVLRVIEGLYPHSEGRRIPKDEIKDKQQQRGVEHLERLAQSLYQSVSWEDSAQWSLDLPVTAKETIKLPSVGRYSEGGTRRITSAKSSGSQLGAAPARSGSGPTARKTKMPMSQPRG